MSGGWGGFRNDGGLGSGWGLLGAGQPGSAEVGSGGRERTAKLTTASTWAGAQAPQGAGDLSIAAQASQHSVRAMA
jgi:hypothetical protein